ncbi:acyl-CoA dehydrogenase family protein [Peterkaempfera bronchialis]|uniref:acyl-CoA dehydrogenase family protein n=1 Tax=Peterkaempfera bronchialis TaxID=2126346 RepID=UPI003C30DB97
MDRLLHELRAFLETETPRFHEKWEDRADSWEARCDWQRTMAAGGWAAPAWSPEHGGRGVGVAELLAIEEATAASGMPALPGMLGLKNVGPTIAAWGTEAQKRHLAGILTTDEVWCQGFSEPGAGSDLAGLRSRAVRDGDDFVVNGQKIWTSNGMYATHMELLVRTDPEAPKHQGISVLLVEMDTPGIEVRPIRQINGEAEFAEVFFTDVRVPVGNLLGPLNAGWQVTRTTLGHERSGVAIFTARFEKQVRELIADRVPDGDRPPLPPALVDRLVGHYIEARVLGMLSRQMMSRLAAGQDPGPEQSVIKLAWSEALQRLAGTGFELDGLDSIAAEEGTDPGHEYLTARSATIAAGTSQIVRTILAERVLGLPRG